MKTRFKRKIKIKIIFFIQNILIVLFISNYIHTKYNININNNQITEVVKNTSFKNKTNYIIKKLISNMEKNIYNNTILSNNNISNNKKSENQNNNLRNSPLIYLYNTHQSEEYSPSTVLEHSIIPTVIMNNYILEDIFNKNGYNSIVEETSIEQIIKNNNWKYVNSYQASRILLEDKIIKYPSLKYFIDIHRDSIEKDKTTVVIDNKQYAKVLFIIGLENPNYKDNLSFTEKINNKINEIYPNLSRGIYKKGGKGVNGVYNQDFNKNTILIEIGGVDNTTDEVLNTTIAFSKVFMEVINEENS